MLSCKNQFLKWKMKESLDKLEENDIESVMDLFETLKMIIVNDFEVDDG